MIRAIDGASDVAVSKDIKLDPQSIGPVNVFANFTEDGVTAVTAVKVSWQASPTGEDAINGVIDNPTLAIGAVDPEKFKITAAFNYLIAGTLYNKAIAEHTFTAAHKIADEKFGAINVYINAAGTVSTLVPGTSQTGTQSYASAALAIAAAEAVVAVVGTILIGRIVISMVGHGGSGWTANTDDLTNASDVTTASFFSQTSTYVTTNQETFSGAELTAKASHWQVTQAQVNRHNRVYVDTITGDAKVTVYATPIHV